MSPIVPREGTVAPVRSLLYSFVANTGACREVGAQTDLEDFREGIGRDLLGLMSRTKGQNISLGLWTVSARGRRVANGKALLYSRTPDGTFFYAEIAKSQDRNQI